MQFRILPLAGPIAALLFFSSLTGFAAIRTDDYMHTARWVSELGEAGAPHALAFNLLGFVIPGLLVVLFAIHLGGALQARTGPLFLALSGLSFALVGVFPMYGSSPGATSSLLHIIMAHACGLCFGAALVALSSTLRGHPQFSALGKLTAWFIFFLVLYPTFQLLSHEDGLRLGGWGQRVALAAYFLWLALAGWRLSRPVRVAPAATAAPRSHAMRWANSTA